MIIYEKNNDVSVVNKVHAQVCVAASIPQNSSEAKELSSFLEAEWKRGVTDHKRLVDMALAKISASGRVVKNKESPTSQK